MGNRVANYSSACDSPINLIFGRGRSDTCELPAVKQLFRDCEGRCATALHQTATLNVGVKLEAIEPKAVERLLVRRPDVATLAVFVPEWGAHAFIRLDVALVFSALVTMYGGDPGERSVIADRALTPLEQALAVSLARALAGEMLMLLAATSKPQPRLVEEIDPQMLGGEKAEYIDAKFRIAETGHCIIMAVPESAFDRLGSQIETNVKTEAAIVDPDWDRELRRNVNSTSIALVAKMSCPSLPLSAVARLQPGALLEFSGDAMKSILLTGSDQLVFVGRLGQSHGMFTVMLERPAIATGKQ